MLSIRWIIPLLMADLPPRSPSFLGSIYFLFCLAILTTKILIFANCIVLRSPDAASVKPKMLYAGSKDALLKVLVGISVKVNATDMSEISEKIVQDACRKF